MSEDIPDPERTVIVEKAHLLHEQAEFSDDENENASNYIEAAYHETRAAYTRERIDAIEGDGLAEQDVRDARDEIKAEFDEYDEECADGARLAAKWDTEKQILGEYFGETDNVVEVGEAMNVMGYEDGAVAFHGPGGKAIVEFSDEINARAAADCILDGVGAEDEAAMVGQR